MRVVSIFGGVAWDVWVAVGKARVGRTPGELFGDAVGLVIEGAVS